MPIYEGGIHLRRLIREETNKAPIGRVTVDGAGPLAVVRIHTSRPDRVQRGRTEDLVPELERTLKKSVTVEIVPEARAEARQVRIPPNKARRLMDELRGKYADEALAYLQFAPNRGAEYLGKLILSAVANAEEGWGADIGELKISLLKADAGPTIKRIQPRAMGRAYRILRRSSHLTVALQAAERTRRPRGRRRGAAAVTRVD